MRGDKQVSDPSGLAACEAEVRVPGGRPMMLVISPEAVPLLSEDSRDGRAARRFVLQAAQYGRKAGVGVLISRETADRISGPGREVRDVLQVCSYGPRPESPATGGGGGDSSAALRRPAVSCQRRMRAGAPDHPAGR